ncbi:MAG TPA: NAD(P)-dependent oxidoreductase, partial [Dehalococcoidia bacterium]|nr:NAD(P)-dependent oxidoreductase [Dehalococcoidia bacterium]
MKVKWVLVTGSNGGIGSAICTVLRNTGFSLLGIDKRLNPHGE